jgi:FdhE protein
MELVELHRRIQTRVPLPSFDLSAAVITRHQDEGRPLLRFEDIPLAPTDFRLLVRQTSDVLYRFGALEATEFQRIQALGRDESLVEVAREWYRSVAERTAEERSHVSTAGTGDAPSDHAGMLNQVMTLAMRPFLSRCAEVLQQRPELDRWRRAYCALCGSEPEMGVMLPGAQRRLVCGRCTLKWAFDATTCPFCLNDHRARITSFTTTDGRYRVDACDVCRRYLKSLDRVADRPPMPLVDAVAMLPLDAAAMQRGYAD